MLLFFAAAAMAHDHHHECDHDHDAHETPAPNTVTEYSFVLFFAEPVRVTDVDHARIAQDLALPSRIDGDALRFGDRVTLSDAEPVVDRDALDQSWNWREVKRLAPHWRGALELTVRSEGEAWRDRVAEMRRILRALLLVLEPQGVLAPHSQQYLNPEILREALADDPGDELFGFVNIRLFKLDGGDDVLRDASETVMDTLGLGALGLPDLQAHFKHLDPTLVAEFLYNTAVYIYEQGPLIESGHTLAGFAADHKWKCQLEASLVEPQRLVVDLDPGRPYSA